MRWEFLLLPVLPVLAIGACIAINLFFERHRQTEFFRKRSTAQSVFSASKRQWICTKCGQVVTDQEHGT